MIEHGSLVQHFIGLRIQRSFNFGYWTRDSERIVVEVAFVEKNSSTFAGASYSAAGPFAYPNLIEVPEIVDNFDSKQGFAMN